MRTSSKTFLEAIDKANRIALTSHDRPDGDAIGSLLGMGLSIEQNTEKSVLMINNDNVPEALSFLPKTERVQRPDRLDSADLESIDLIIALDSAGKDRISDRVWNALPKSVPILNIDHHISNTQFGDSNIVNPDSPATGEIIYSIIAELDWSIDRAIADNLFAAISTDTGSFRYPNTTAQTYRAAAAMIEAGVDIGEINQHLYESFPLSRVNCIRDLLQDMKLSFDQRCASVRLTKATKERLKLNPGDSEGVIEIIRATDSVVVAVLFEELDGGSIRVSSRSKSSSANVGKICESFGGGGHNLAAGARVKGSIEAVETQFLQKVGEVLNGN